MSKDLRRIIRELERQGFEVTTTRSGHHTVRLSGVYVTTFAGTTSDWRSMKNGVAAARRAGFVWPPSRR